MPWPKTTWVERGLFGLSIPSQSTTRKVKAGTQAGAEARTTEELCLLACSKSTFNYLSYTAQNPMPSEGGAAQKLNHSAYVSKTGLTDMPTCQSDGGRSLVTIPSFQVCLSLCRINTMTASSMTPQTEHKYVLYLLSGSSASFSRCQSSIILWYFKQSSNCMTIPLQN